ncbi:hypothetical protein DH2020_023013 [Rehmannia glutinosa]|uniref:Aluminum-activated malate transporter n=1 Tax=Rehmannia glutinosa TaxID=99300 RepID=A0ABR0W960_REHGL
MVKASEICRGFECRINFPDGISKVLVPERMSQSRVCRGSHGFVKKLLSKFWGLNKETWNLAMNEPKKLIHGFKVGMALSLVSLFYYMKPLYEGIGGNAMWAVLTVIVVFEYTVGATLSKCLNKAAGTFLAGVLAAAATFSRFIPSIKAQFDYGVLVFILTICFITVSGYRVENLLELALHRLSTIAIGSSICILTSMLFCPVWAGNELHNLIRNNMEKLADSLDGCIAQYFGCDINSNNTQSETSNNILLGYKCVLDSRDTEESLANFARWEPAHRGFNFGHPWKEYLKVGASLRSCAYCIKALNCTIDSGAQGPDILKNHFSKCCIKLSSNSSAVLKELVVVMDTMTKSPKIDFKVSEMCSAVQEVQNALKALSKQPIANPTIISLTEVVPLVTLSSLLIEIAGITGKIAKDVNGFANKA